MGCLTDSIEINKINLPLSKKYYKELCERVEEAIYTVVASLPYGISFYQVVNTINAYLIYGIIPDTMSSPDVRLIFHLIQPELDKAVARSKRAREAAVRRREAKENKSCGPSDETTGPESSPIEAAEIAETVETSEQTKNNDRKSEFTSPVEAASDKERIVEAPNCSLSPGSRRRRQRHKARMKKRKTTTVGNRTMV